MTNSMAASHARDKRLKDAIFGASAACREAAAKYGADKVTNATIGTMIDDEGKLEMVGKARGRNAALKGLLKDYVAEMGVDGVPKVVFITHTSLYKEADHLADMLRQVAEPGTEVYTICETPIIGVHTGPDFFSICGWGKRRKRK